MILRLLVPLACSILLLACSKPEPVAKPATRASILLVTLDTTRADAVGPDTPAFNALAARGRIFRQAYATAPQTLPSHASMMTGLYPGGHGVHENARPLAARHPVLAEKLRETGYRTAAFISAFPLVRRFGLARGFDSYDDEVGEERSAKETTDRALRYLEGTSSQPLFLWVHYFEPHYPYAPPDAFRARYAANPYRGEVAAMDEQLGRLVQAFEQRVSGPKAILVLADHGEGLGDHGEAQHGNLLYQSVMHVPLVVLGPDLSPGTSDVPVSTRRVFHTILDFAGLGADRSLRGVDQEVVLGEAMIPFLQYGWQPQVMAVEGARKVIHAGQLEVYDVIKDPAEQRELGDGDVSREVRAALREYPLPSLEAAPAGENLSEEERRRLASLGYMTAGTRPIVRKDAPRPRDMAHLFDVLDQASGLFVREKYSEAIPLFEQILAEDGNNLMAALRLAAAHSALGRNSEALAAFRRAEAIAPSSPDVRHYLALHYAKTKEWERAVPMLERIVAESPDRLPALEALALLRERQGRLPDAISLRQKVRALRPLSVAELAHLGGLAMTLGQTTVAIEAFESARRQDPASFRNDLELGVLYLANQQFPEAREALDRVPEQHPGYAMAMFKRAQVSVLLREPDRAARIEKARLHADATTRALIAAERLFR